MIPRRSWVEVRAQKGGEWRWTLHLPDGKQHTSPVGYTREQAASQGFERFRNSVSRAMVVVMRRKDLR